MPLMVWLLADLNFAAGQSVVGANAPGQINGVTVPAAPYFAALTMYKAGQFREAAATLSTLVKPIPLNGSTRDRFLGALAGLSDPRVFEYRAIRLGNLPTDDICYFTMRGECSYQLGNYAAALLDYQAALATHLANDNWLDRLTLPEVTQRLNASPLGWGLRGTTPADFPTTVTVGGQISFLTRSTAAQRIPVKTICVQEMARCLALAIYRWHELGGPLCDYHPFSKWLTTRLGLLSSPARWRNPWARTWAKVEAGMVAALEGRTAEAIPKLQEAALFGELDHPLTGYALLMLGRLSDKPDEAEKYFVQASLAAGRYNDLAVVEEALRAAAQLHLSTGKQAKFAPLEEAIAWASTAGSIPLQATLLLLAAENDYRLGQIESATTRLKAAAALVTPTEMATGRIGARLNYLNALVAYRSQNPAAGEPALQAALAYQRLGSFWQFRAGMIELANFTKAIPAHRAAELYMDVFGGPRSADWLTDPLESLSSLLIPHAPSYERWLELPKIAEQPKLAFDIAERTRRHRFLSTLDLGGRMLALRWVLEAPEASLTPTAIRQRLQLLSRVPRYGALSHRSRELRARLAKLPLAAEERAEVKRQKELLTELKQISVEQETMLRQLALEHQDCEIAFPPPKPIEQLQDELADDQAIWTFLETSQHVHACWLTKHDLSYWQLDMSPKQLAARIRELLGQWGNRATNRELNHRDLAEDRWREAAQQLLQELTKGGRVDLAARKELIVVPDGELWQLPFEILLAPAATPTNADRPRLRYSPTAGLAVGDARPHGSGMSLLVPAKASSREHRATETERLNALQQAVPGAVALPDKLTVEPALLSTLIDQLIVWRDVPAADDVYRWQPIPLAAKATASGLTEWMALPWGGPDQAFFLSYHLPGAHPHKGNHTTVQPTNDLFLALCGLMATGTRTVLISRWRTGGQTNHDLLRDFAQELPRATAAEAWQRAVQAVTASPLTADKEPRLRHENGLADPSASHPFFWAGLLMADTGSPPAPD